MSTHQLFIHIVWTTLDRQPMIDRTTRDFLDSFLRKTASKQDVEVVDLAILKTHVHLVVRTPPRLDLPRLVQFFKGGSSYTASRLPGNKLGLRWAPEYSATTVSPKHLDRVGRYLAGQANHHPHETIE
ncbi:MAG TPA: IS200/IS605 family transposase [Gemmatimonadales bacterium]|nr:IS200/IS605 family transposase [Gemmatimonadales bacterium]